MEISVDRELCEANGRCVGIAPHLFRLDDEDELHVHAPSSTDIERVLEAIAACPRTALALKE